MAREMDLRRDCYDFTRNWFRARNLETFRKYVHPRWAGLPITYLEIGVFEGMSMCWMFEHVLTSLESKAVGIDPWIMTTKLDNDYMYEVMERAYRNTDSWLGRRILVRGSSVEVLRRMLGRGGYKGISKQSVDLAMIDGDHNRLGAYDDARNCLELVKPGGQILFDDVENDRQKQDHVKDAIEMFLADFGDRVKQVWKHKYMECYEVL